MTKAMLVGILALGAAPLAWGAEAKATLAIRGIEREILDGSP